MRFVFALLVVVLLVSDAQAGWLFGRRARACHSGACHASSYAVGSAVQKSGPVQKDESAVQKADNAVQKDTPVQKEEAVQKDGPVQKADDAVQKDAVQKSAVQKSASSGSPLYSLCLRKARWQAARGRVGHPGWGMGGCRYEGAGSGSTPAQALGNCCYSGQRRVAAQAVVKGANGRYYATRLFW
jgi:hypothetical protein